MKKIIISLIMVSGLVFAGSTCDIIAKEIDLSNKKRTTGMSSNMVNAIKTSAIIDIYLRRCGKDKTLVDSQNKLVKIEDVVVGILKRYE